MPPRLQSLREIELELGLTRETLYRWIAAGKLRAWKVGSQYRVPASEVARLTRPACDFQRSRRP